MNSASHAANSQTGQREPVLWPRIQSLIEQDIANQPRSLQKTIGPSEMGTDCVHCLAAKLVGWERTPRPPAWMPYIGTAVHARFEQLFTRLSEQQGGRYLTEYRVTVGQLFDLHGEAYPITGSIDLWDQREHATIDWKIVGNSTLTLAKAHGPSQQYRVQASLYGLGLANEQEPPELSCVYFLPRNGQTLADAIPWETKWDPRPGRWALARCQLLVTLLTLIETEYGPDMCDQWIGTLPRSQSHCFDCGSWAHDRTPERLLNEDTTPDTDGLPERLQRFRDLIEPTYTPQQ
ncbi:hypothetical protein EM849_03530 [Bifidobacterium tissieri]|nr:hypothetical protein EM849_03530 [Bifidobacterium tissieri]